jgi:hypothetical protein
VDDGLGGLEGAGEVAHEHGGEGDTPQPVGHLVGLEPPADGREGGGGGVGVCQNHDMEIQVSPNDKRLGITRCL